MLVCRNVLYGINDVATTLDSSEDDMLTIKVRCALKSYEELGTICISTSVGHGQQMLLLVADFEIFVSKFAPINALTASAIAFGKITTLSHKT